MAMTCPITGLEAFSFASMFAGDELAHISCMQPALAVDRLPRPRLIAALSFSQIRGTAKSQVGAAALESEAGQPGRRAPGLVAYSAQLIENSSPFRRRAQRSGFAFAVSWNASATVGAPRPAGVSVIDRRAA
jgi:hypothetical protein